MIEVFILNRSEKTFHQTNEWDVFLSRIVFVDCMVIFYNSYQI